MGAKESGARYQTLCAGCGDELVVGWFRDGTPNRTTAPPHPPPLPGHMPGLVAGETDAAHVALGPVVCYCGCITLRFDPATGRARVDWLSGAEPTLANVNLH